MLAPLPDSAAAITYPWGEAVPEPGASVELLPGVRWLRMGLPFALNHLNLWLLEDTLDGVHGWTVVDCGIDSAPTRAAWETVFATQLDGKPILRVVVTHMHPDHVGLAHWLTQRWNCMLWMSGTDYAHARMAATGALAIGPLRSELQYWLFSAVNSNGAVSPLMRARASSTPVVMPGAAAR